MNTMTTPTDMEALARRLGLSFLERIDDAQVDIALLERVAPPVSPGTNHIFAPSGERRQVDGCNRQSCQPCGA